MTSHAALAAVRSQPEHLRARPQAWKNSAQAVRWDTARRAWVIETVCPCWPDAELLPNLSITEEPGWEVVGRALLVREAERCPNREPEWKVR